MGRRVAVIGGGVAGICAALAASEAGAEVLVLERREVLGGSGRISGGLFWTFRSAERLGAYLPDGDARLQRVLVERFEDTLDWFGGFGAQLGEPREVLGGLAHGRPLVDGRTGSWPGPFDQLEKALRDRGVDVRTGVRIRQVHAEEGHLVVATLDRGHTSSRFEADAVVLASGGYHRDRERLARYLGAAADRLLLRSAPGSTGDGLRIGLELGGSVSAGHGSFYGHTMPACDVPSHEDFHPLTAYYASAGILVDQSGRRFTDETSALNEERNPQAAIQHADGIFYAVFTDATIDRMDAVPGARVPHMRDRFERARELGTPVVSAGSVGELAQAAQESFGMDARTLRDTVEAFNAGLADEPQRLAPPRRTRRDPLDTPTFHAMRCVAGITGTYGGLSVDRDCRLLDDEGTPVEGVWVAGADAGGVFVRGWAGGLAWAIVSGRLAGTAAA